MRVLPRPPRWAPAVLLAVLAALSAPAGPAGAAAPTLHTVPPVTGTLGRLHVSGSYAAGISSGADMAEQLQVAHSARIAGTAVFGAAPYYCARDDVVRALQACGATTLPDDLPGLEADAALWSGYGWIDPVSGLTGRPVWAFHGGADTVVARSVSDDAVAFLRHFGARVTYDTGSPAGHGWVTPYGTTPCGTTAPPYLNDCGTDPQHAMLATLFGSVTAPETGPLSGRLVRFDQNRYAVTGSAASLSMADAGFAYLPAACSAGAPCRLVVALHGCHQGYGEIGTAFVDRSGLDQYADTNDVVVLYPQAAASPVNPEGCWDWWGYLGATSYPIRGGPQVETIMNMVTALGG